MDYRLIYLKNTTASIITLSGLGLSIGANDTTAIDWEDIDRIVDDYDLRNLITAGTIVVNNGTSDLSASSAFSYLDPFYDLSNNYYTQIQLNAGQLDARYYTKTQSDTTISGYYTKTQVDTALGGYVTTSTLSSTISNYYTKTQADSTFAIIAHNHDSVYYTKTQMQTSGSASLHWDNLTSKPLTFTPPIATALVLGGVKIGTNVNVTGDGTISVTFPSAYSLPIATTSILGGVKIGNGVNVDAGGIISVTPYTLPQATGAVLGGVIVGSGVNVSNGVISVTPYTLPIATTTVLGGVKQGSNITIAGDGTISASAAYTLPIATTTVLGGVKIGTNIGVAGDGTISVATGTTTTLGIVSAPVGSGLGISSGALSVNWSGTGTATSSSHSDHTHINDAGIGGPYYTQTQLQTSGQSSVNWGNVTNKPTFGGNNWLLPVKSKYVGNVAPSSGTGFASGDRVIWYSGTGSNHHIYVWTTVWTDLYTPVLNDTVMVTDDGDGKSAQYFFNGTLWIKIADADWGSHGSLSGLTNDDHPQYHNGSLAYTAGLNMGGFAITNVGNVDGIDISTHTHATGQGGQIDHINLASIGTNSHTAIDTHISDSTKHFTVASIDHGSITGLGDDDHTQYILATGTRAFTGVVSGITPTINAHLATKGYADGLITANYDYKIITGPAGFSTLTATKNADTLGLATGNNLLTITSSTPSGVNTINFTVNNANIDHGVLAGLSDDDHTQYLNSTRHSALTANPHGVTLTQVLAADPLTTGVVTTTEIVTLQGGGNASTLHIHDDRYFTETELGSTTVTSGAARIGISTIAGIAATNVQAAIAELYSDISASGSTLQQAYTAGRTISTTQALGPVIISAASTNPPLQLTSQATVPTTSLAGGGLVVVGNVLYIYDGVRAKWLSPSKAFQLGNAGGTKGQQLRAADGVGAVGTGINMPQKGTITSIAVNSTTTGTTTNQGSIYVNGSSQYTFTFDTNGNAVSTSLNIDVQQNDTITVIMSSSMTQDMQNVTANIEYCWRLS